MTNSFAIWITGLPASGKSTITKALVARLRIRNVFPVVLESDRMRQILTPEASYREDERDRFYRQLVDIGEIIFRSGVPIIFDATANRKSYRERARTSYGNFVEVYVNSPLELCQARDPKGLYAAALAGTAATIPGTQTPYEPPASPELVVDGTQSPDQSGNQIIEVLQALHYL